MQCEIRLVDGGFTTPVVIEAGEGATVGGLRAALADLLGRARDLHLSLEGAPLTDDQPLPAVGMLTAAAVHLQRAAAAPPAVAAEWEVAAAGGLAAGGRVDLPAGRSVAIGRAKGRGLVLDDPEVSRRHATVSVAGAAVTVADAGSRNGTGRRGYRIGDDAALDDGDVFQVGETLIAVRRVPVADARMERDNAAGIRRYNRPPRILPPTTVPSVSVPAKPRRPQGFRFPLAAILLPLLAAGIVYALIPTAGYFLIFLALSPVMMIANVISDRRSGRKEYKAKLAEYEIEVAAARATLTQLAATEECTDRDTHLDPAAVVHVATAPTGRLFERRPANPDFLRLRVGVADRPAVVQLAGPGAEDEKVPTVYAAPVTVDLPAAGVLGVAGPREPALAIARAALIQTATLHAPHDVGIVVLTGADTAADWEWASWLPHTLPHRADMMSLRMVATDLPQAEARIAELRRIIAERLAEQRSALRSQALVGRRLVVVADGAHRLRALPGLAELLTEGPDAGVYAVCLDVADSHLPDECHATVVVTSASGTRVRVSRPGCAAVAEVLADGLAAPLAARVAHALAPVRVLGARFGDDGDLPEEVRYLDLAGLPVDASAGQLADQVVAGWASRPGGRCTRALLGVGATGPVEIDLRRDGPHALIAGTSGSGKSELLQSLVASLALGNAPDALNFMLVDYKGGSAFADCRELPHCVGMITDLDGHLAGRALASLSAELRRREAILAESGAKDIEDYWATTGGRLPRLVIVIDEFASLVEEVPDFVTGVVGIGMRGRSLGVHVVLATQRPGGVVNAELRANVNLRLCLRVTSGPESVDVIDVPDAAKISRHHPGRAYLRTGHSDLAMLQCARIGWPRAEEPAGDRAAHSTVDSRDETVRVTYRRVADLGRIRPAARVDNQSGHDGETDLSVLVVATRLAAAQAGVVTPPSPWLPPLPEVLIAAQLDPPADAGATSPVAAVLGLADHPTRQAQTPYLLDLDGSGPVAIAGMARTGRSTTLRTLAAGLAAGASPADVHLYALDFGSRALAPLADLPHCGAWVDGDDTDRVDRLIGLLVSEVGRRQRLLAAGGFGALREQRAAVAPDDRLPYLVLLLDQYETFLARYRDVDAGRLVEALDGLLRQGPGVGVLLVMSCDRSGFTGRIGSAVATRLVLRQAEPDDVAVYGLHPREAPRSMPPGRVVVVPGAVEVQVALLDPEPDGAAQAAAVARLTATLRHRWDGLDPARHPHRVDPLPTSITTDELARLRTQSRTAAATACTIGVGGDHLAPVDFDLADAGGAFLVCGPPGTGRSSALLAVIDSLTGRDTGELPVAVVCPRPSPLRDLAGLPGIVDVITDVDDLTDQLAEAVAAGPVAVVVDDAELLGDSAISSAAATLLERLVRESRDAGGPVIAAGTTEDLMLARYRGWLAAARRSRTGLLLNPLSYVDGEIFDLKLPRSVCGGWPPGRGLLVHRGSAAAVQVPIRDVVLR